jgi:hypothetical protein
MPFDGRNAGDLQVLLPGVLVIYVR